MMHDGNDDLPATGPLLTDKSSQETRPREHPQDRTEQYPPRDPPRPSPAGSLWDALDIARYLKVSRNWVYLQADAGKLPSVRIGGIRRFHPEKIKALASGELFEVQSAKRK